MKKTQRKELFADIIRSKVSFISITMFIILGVAIYLGLGWLGNGLKDQINIENNKGNAHDVELFFPYGINDEDIKTLANVEEISEVEPYFVGFENFDIKGVRCVAKLVSINDLIDIPFDLEGKMPTSDDEILVEKGATTYLDIKIGDSIEFYGDEANTSYLINVIKKEPEEAVDLLKDIDDVSFNYLKSKKLKVVGIAESPEYISISYTAYGQSAFTSAQAQAVFFVNKTAFNEEVKGPYNYLAIRYKGLESLKYNSQEYIDQVKEINETLQNKYDELSKLSYNHVNDGYNNIDTYLKNELDDAKKQIEDGKVEINKNNNKLIDGNQKLIDAKKELDDALSQIEEAEETLEDYEDQYNYYVALLKKVKTTYTKYETEIEKAKNGTITNEEVITILSDPDIKAFGEAVKVASKKAPVKIDSNFDIEDYIDFSEFEITEEITIDELYNFVINYSDDIINYLGDGEKPWKEADEDAYQAALLAKSMANTLGEEKKESFLTIVVLFGLWDDMNKAYTDRIDISDSLENDEAVFMANATLHGAETIIPICESFTSIVVMMVYDNIVPAFDNYLASVKDELDKGWKKLNDAKYLYELGLIEYNKGLAEYKSGVNKLNKAKSDLEDGEKKYAEGLEAYEEFKDNDGFIKEYGTLSFVQEDNTAMMYNIMLTDIIAKIKVTLGGLFLAIGLLVCYSVVSRKVNDDVKLIGTKKAVGFNRKEITRHYLLYAAITVLVGGLIGGAIAVLAVEPIVAPSVTGTFTHDLAGDYYDLKEFLILVGIEFILVELMAYLACYKLLRKDAIKLLQAETTNRSKVRFYEKFGIYKRLPLLTKTIINNFVNDRSRIFATVIGIAGSMALIVSSLMMRNNVLECFASQFTKYFTFDSFIYFDQENDQALNNIYEVLDSYEITYTPVKRELGYSNKEGKFDNLFTYIMVYDQDDLNFEKLINFKSVDGETFEMGETWLSNAIQQEKNLGKQDDIEYKSVAGVNGEVHVDGFYNYYYYSSMLFTPIDTYEENFNDEYKPNVILIDTDGINKDDLMNDLLKTDGYQSFLDYEAHVGADALVFTSIANMLVALYGSAATLMALFVILNLLITFVEEKKKELIVLMINGFSLKQAKRYIYSDTILLTIVGIIIGAVIGTIAGNNAIKAYESIYLYLIHDVNYTAILIGAIVTIILTFIMSCIALSRIAKFRLTEINKD